MAADIKTLQGGMNMDDSAYALPPNDYVDALNISHDAVIGSNDKVITNLIANRIGDVSYNYPAGRMVAIGAYANTLRNTVIQMIWNVNGYHSILEFSITTRLHTKIFENLTDSGSVDVLGFTEFDKITSINVYNRDEGDLLFFIDSLKRPTGLDITQFKAGAYIPVTRQILDKLKCPPLVPPICIYGNDTVVHSNYLKGKLFKFRYDFGYDDFERSLPSTISAVSYPDNINDDLYTNILTNNNVINLSFSIEGITPNVKNLRVYVSLVDKVNDWSDFQIVTTIERVNFGTDVLYVPFNFYNDSTYPIANLEESVELFDYVPDEANCQDLVDGNVLVYSGIREGFDKDLVPNVTSEVLTYNPASGTVGTVVVTIAIIIADKLWKIDVLGTMIPGVTITLKAFRKSTGSTDTIASFTSIIGSTLSSAAAALAAGVNAYGRGLVVSSISGGEFFIQSTTASHSSMTAIVTFPNSVGLQDSIATFPWSSSRNVGLTYYSKKGKTNGVIYNKKITFPAYSENGSFVPQLPYLKMSIYHQPPIWADSYQWVFTDDPLRFIFWQTVDVDTSEADYIYFEVTNFITNAAKLPATASVVNYSFQDGDRMRLIRRTTDNIVFDDTYDAAVEGLVVDPTINSVVKTGKQYIKIKKIAPFSTVVYTSKFFIIQLYRIGQATASESNETYYECGQQGNIGDAGLSTRYHLGAVQNQNLGTNAPSITEIYQGDSYFRTRKIYISDSGLADFYMQDRNFVDIYTSAVSSLKGRPTVIDINARNQYYGTLTRSGQAYQANTNINGLGRFFSKNFDEYDYSFGDVIRIKVRDRQMRVFQKYKTGAVSLFSSIGKDANNLQVIFQTDKLLNPIQYYVGNFGIGTCGESLASNRFADYFCDNIHGVICRVSNDGVQPISILYKTNSWSNDNLPLRTGVKKIYGAFDPRLNNYIAVLDDVSCVGVSLPSFTLNAAISGTLFTQTVDIIGSLDFNISNKVKPAWMTITVLGNQLIFSGTPSGGDIGTGIPVTFTLTNDCGVLNVSKSISVSDIVCIAGAIVGTPVLPDGTEGVFYTYTITLTGTAPFSISSPVKPSWMSIDAVGNTIALYGTPDATGTGITISFNIDNCSADTIPFSDTIDIAAAARTQITGQDSPILNNSCQTTYKCRVTANIGDSLTITATFIQGFYSAIDPVSPVTLTYSGPLFYYNTLDNAAGAGYSRIDLEVNNTTASEIITVHLDRNNNSGVC